MKWNNIILLQNKYEIIVKVAFISIQSLFSISVIKLDRYLINSISNIERHENWNLSNNKKLKVPDMKKYY